MNSKKVRGYSDPPFARAIHARVDAIEVKGMG